MNRNSALNEILIALLTKIDPHFRPGVDGLTVDIVLESYPEAAVAGHVPGKNDLKRQYPELGAQLDTLFAKPHGAPHHPSDPVVSPLYFEHTD